MQIFIVIEGSNCVCLSVILIDTVFKMRKKDCLQVFLEECKYIVKENKMSKCATMATLPVLFRFS